MADSFALIERSVVVPQENAVAFQNELNTLIEKHGGQNGKDRWWFNLSDDERTMLSDRLVKADAKGVDVLTELGLAGAALKRGGGKPGKSD